MLTQLQSKAREFKYFSLALDESTDITDTAQLLIIIHGIDNIFNIIEELVSLESIHDRTTGADIFEKVKLCIHNIVLDWENLSNITIDSAPSMRGENIGFIGRVNKLLKLKNIKPPMCIHCIITIIIINYYSSASFLWKSYKSRKCYVCCNKSC